MLCSYYLFIIIHGDPACGIVEIALIGNDINQNMDFEKKALNNQNIHTSVSNGYVFILSY